MTPADHIARADELVASVEEHLSKRGRKLGDQQAHELALAQAHASLAIAKQQRPAS